MWIPFSLVVPAMLAGHTATFQVFKVTAPNKEGYAAAGVESRIGKDLLLGTQSAGIGSGRPGDYFGHSGDDNNEAEAAGVLPGTHDSQIPLLSAIPATKALTADNNVGKLPALGWNSWNAYNCDINEAHFLSAAQKLVDLGLKDAGYEYVNIDDCYSQKERDYTTHQIVPDFTKFPNGLNSTAQKIHDMGLKIGIYSSAGNYTCAGYPASLGYEELDAKTFADWGFDYLKYDNCNYPDDWKDECEFCIPDSDNHRPPEPHPNGTCSNSTGSQCPDDYDWSKSKTAERYRRMRDALKNTGRTFLYSICEWGEAKVYTWGNDTGASWRSTGDISPNWGRILEILNENSFQLDYTNFWGHSDPDMLEVGNGDLTYVEGRSHFALWAAMKSPLLIGTDLAKLDPSNVDVLKNKYLLAFNQDDTFGAPAKPYKWGTNPDHTWNASFPAEFFSGQFKQGTMVLALNNKPNDDVKTIDYSEIPGLQGDKAYQITDAWTGSDWGCLRSPWGVSLSSHDTAVLVVGSECTPKNRRAGFISKTFQVR